MIDNLKKKKGLYSLITMITLTTFAWTFVIAFPQQAVASSVPTGTPVTIVTVSSIAPESATVGDSVPMRVASDVKVNGRVVIAANAPAKGEVTQVERKGLLGKQAKIGITVRTIQAVDGTNVFATGNRVIEGEDKMVMSIVLTVLCLFGFLIKGGSAVIAAGTPIECFTN
jgi:hypothetical protein